MLKYVRYALMPVAAALVLAMAPAEAISPRRGHLGQRHAVRAAQPQPLTRKQLKQQRKLQKKCAKLAAGKIKKAKKRAKYEKLCASPVAPSAQGRGRRVGAGP